MVHFFSSGVLPHHILDEYCCLFPAVNSYSSGPRVQTAGMSNMGFHQRMLSFGFEFHTLRRLIIQAGLR